VLVSGRVLLRLEQGVEVPEGALDEVVGRHLREATGSREFMSFVRVFLEVLDVYRPARSPHLQEDLPELRPHLHQRVHVAAVGGHAQRLEVVGLEFLLLPAAAETRERRTP